MLPDKIWRFVWKDEKIYIHFMYIIYFDCHLFDGSIRSSGTSGSMKNIPKPKLLEILVPIAPVSERNKFGTIVEKALNTHGNLLFLIVK